TDVLIGKDGAVTDGQHITAHPVIGEGHRRAGVAVVDLVLTGGRHVQQPRGDIGGRAGGGGGEGVVAGVRTRHSDAGDGDRLARADALVGEAGGAVHGQ